MNQERLRFYTNITHELRTPLTLILGPLEDMQKDTSLPTKQVQKLSVIHQSALRLLNLINQILAEHVCCTTPEQQMRQVFTCLTQAMNSAFRVQEQGSDAMLSILGSVQYKYRPTIRYSVELHRELHSEKVGLLKISCRTQSRTLLEAMQQFFLFWVQLEQEHEPEGACALGLYQIEPNRLTRVLLRHGITSNEVLGTATGKYIQMFHTVLQSYFQGLQQGLPAAVLQHALEQQYAALHEQLVSQL